MKTTELFVEQVLIGLMALLGAGAFVDLPVGRADPVSNILGGATLLAIAYLAGMVLERFADSILGSLEKRRRLLWLKKARKRDSVVLGHDPFPESLIKVAVLEASSATNDKFSYLRSRLRLTRSIAVLTPGVALLHMASTAGFHWAGSVAAVATLYVLAFMFGTAKSSDLVNTRALEVKGGKLEFPGGLEWYRDDVPYVGLLALVCGAIIYIRTLSPHVLYVGVGALVVTVVSAWAWWRISHTYHKFLDDFWAYQANELDQRTAVVVPSQRS